VMAMNPDGLLYPYMTTNVQFELDKRTNVLKVPNAALAYTPLTEDQVAPEFRSELEKLAQKSGPRDASPAATEPQTEGKGKDHKPADPQPTQEAKGLLWAREGDFLKPVAVRVGMSDGAMTEVDSPELKEGLAVVVSEQRQTAAPQGGSPFVPQMRKR
jgi:HlyD family secretion protein